MTKNFWQATLSNHAVPCHFLARMTVLALMISTLIGSVPLSSSGTAHAQTTTAGTLLSRTVPMQAQVVAPLRLETFVRGEDGAMWHKWSDDNGTSWSAWESLGSPVGVIGPILPGESPYFSAEPAVVSFIPGHLNVFAMGTANLSTGGRPLTLQSDTYSNGQWSGWRASFPGTSNNSTRACTSSGCFDFYSEPAVSSWGPGRMDLFVNGKNNAGTRALLHTWADQSTWSGTWEVLGTGLMQGSPASVSWGPGRVDVFVRGGGSELEHKWFDNGHWFSGWENLGGIIFSGGPMVSSWGPGLLEVLVMNTDCGLSYRGFGAGIWGPWVNLDSQTIYSSPAVAASPGSLHVFALSESTFDLVYKRYSNGSWSNWQVLSSPPATYEPSAYIPAAVVWDPVPLPLPPPPPPPKKCGIPGKPPCPIEP